MTQNPTHRQRRLFRVVNILFWLVIYAGAVYMTDAWRDWVAMGLEATIPLLFGGYIHLILRPGGSAADSDT